MINKCINFKIRSKEGQPYYCTFKHTTIDFKLCSVCPNKEYKNTLNKITKATAIPKKVKLKVWERDNHKCVFCNKPLSWNYSNSHFIKRSHLGLGIKENVFTAYPTCHHDFDDTPKREYMLPTIKRYLISKYEYWNEEMLVYKKWGNKNEEMYMW